MIATQSSGLFVALDGWRMKEGEREGGEKTPKESVKSSREKGVLVGEYTSLFSLSSELLFGRHPDGVPRLLGDDVLDPLVDLLRGVSLHHRGEVLAKVLLQLDGALVGLPGLLLRHPLVHLQDALHALGFDEDRDGEELRHVQPFDGVGADVQDAVLPLRGHVHHGLHGRPIQVAVELAGLDEQVRLDVVLHLLYAAKGEEKKREISIKRGGKSGQNLHHQQEISPRHLW